MEARSSTRGWWVALAVAGVVLVFVGGLILTIYTTSPGGGVPVFRGGRIAVVPLRGVIGDDQRVLRQIRDYRRDRSVKGFVLYVNSPGGGVAPSQSLYRELLRVREDGFPVIAAIGSVGASGAYYAALAADSILALPGSLIGSIGVIMQFPNARELLDRVGLKFEVVKSGEHKDLGSPYREFSEADRALLQEVVDDVYEQFVDVVAEERGLSRDSVMKVADGRLLSGRRALQYGLIDGHGDVVDAIAQAGVMSGLGPDPRVVRPEQRRLGLLDLFISAARWSSRWSEAAGSLSGFWSDRWLGDGPRLWYLTRYH